MRNSLFALLILLNLGLEAQIFSNLYLGPTFSTVRFDDNDLNRYFKEISKPLVGYKIAAGGEFFFSEALSLDLKLDYTLKGFKYQQTYLSGWKKFYYFQIQTLGKIDFDPFSKQSISLFLGPYGAYWLSGEKLQADSRTLTLLHDEIYLKNDSVFKYNRTDLGLVFGLFYKHKINKKTYFFAIAQYELGMISNAIENVDGSKNRTIFLGVGIRFRIKK